MRDKKISIPTTRREFIRQAACAAVGTAAMTSAIRDLRFMNAAVAQSGITSYKALVCIFLGGGNDSNNWILPTMQSDYDAYSAIRGSLLTIPLTGAPNNFILPVTSDNPDGRTYGFHPACPELVQLFNEHKLAILFNTGPLVYPMNRAQFKDNSQSKLKPPQLFSHADQVTQWQTSIPDQPPLTGWGGRCADLLNSVQPTAPISLSVSLGGANTFEVGNVVSQYAVSSSGAIALALPGSGSVYTNRQAALTNILGLPYTNLQSQAYAKVAKHTIDTTTILNNAISPTSAASYWNPQFPGSIVVPTSGATITPNPSLGQQLRMIARLIEAAQRPVPGGFGMKRQIFFCTVGGYDTHTSQTQGATTGSTTTGQHANLLAEVSQCMNAFQRAMEKLDLTYPGISSQVTTFTASDFGRTLATNGDGTDHGWGSHHLVMGGAVQGKKTYGKFPTLALGGPEDADTGRWIPTTACDQYFATLATWFGVDNSNLSSVFPNLGRFATPNLGFI